MVKKELLLEVGTEEIPARMVRQAAGDLTKHLLDAVRGSRLAFDEKGVKTFWTPRRLVVCIPGLDDRQEDLDREVLGPPVRIAFGPDGKSTKAGESFAKTNNVSLEQVGRKATPKGEVLCVRVMETGRPAREVLSEIAPAAIASLTFKKSMKWGDYDAFFVRPVRWICAVLDGEIVPFAYGAVKSGDRTWGLRNHPDPIVVTSFHQYLQSLSGQGVVVDPEMRKKWIAQELKNVSEKAGGAYERDEGLLDEVANLVECPVPFLGAFDAEFLDLPPELLRVTMKHHQRYFPVVAGGAITNRFIGISNTPVKDQRVVTAGNERVLRARLKDAKFFYDEDRKRPLQAYVDRLKGVVFQQKLGTYFDKKERVKEVAAFLAAAVRPGDAALAADAARAADLCKADLVTGMVGEFPELQGVMGRYYALHAGENAAVAAAIQEHYMPTGAAGELPASETGAVLSVADRLDTIAGCFCAGIRPTGSADPFALRRAALGIIRIVIEKRFPLNLQTIILNALNTCYSAGIKPQGDHSILFQDVLGFFKSRLKALFSEEAPPDVVDAFMLARQLDSDIYDLRLRFDAFKTFQSESRFESFATVFKRAQNISKETQFDVQPDETIFSESEELELLKQYKHVQSRVTHLLENKKYLNAMDAIGDLLPHIQAFFEKVYVEVDDAAVRDNRKALLKQIVLLFAEFADFSRMEFRSGKKG